MRSSTYVAHAETFLFYYTKTTNLPTNMVVHCYETFVLKGVAFYSKTYI